MKSNEKSQQLVSWSTGIIQLAPRRSDSSYKETQAAFGSLQGRSHDGADVQDPAENIHASSSFFRDMASFGSCKGTSVLDRNYFLYFGIS